MLSGTTSDHEGVKGQVRFYSITRVQTEGGHLSDDGRAVRVEGANTATLYISIATNFISYHDLGANPVRRAGNQLFLATRKPYAQLLKEHIAAYQHYFNRGEAATRPTDLTPPRPPPSPRISDSVTSHRITTPDWRRCIFSLAVIS